MTDDDTAVTLGEGRPVEGAPLARVGARLMWGIERTTVIEREGETVIRTPDGPRELADVLAEVDVPYFATQQEFEQAVRDALGSGPVPTADSEDESGADGTEGEDARQDDAGDTEEDHDGDGEAEQDDGEAEQEAGEAEQDDGEVEQDDGEAEQDDGEAG
jgi:hypothetical protein